MSDDEIEMYYVEDDGEHAGEHYEATTPEVPPDTRPAHAICNACLRNLHPRRVHRVDGIAVCGHCLSEVTRMQPDLAVLRGWIRLPREERRRRIMLAHRVDPVTGEWVAHLITAERVSVIPDVDGIPSWVQVRTGNHGFGAGIYVLPIPTYWRRYARDVQRRWLREHRDVS